MHASGREQLLRPRKMTDEQAQRVGFLFGLTRHSHIPVHHMDMRSGRSCLTSRNGHFDLHQLTLRLGVLENVI